MVFQGDQMEGLKGFVGLRSTHLISFDVSTGDEDTNKNVMACFARHTDPPDSVVGAYSNVLMFFEMTMTIA